MRSPTNVPIRFTVSLALSDDERIALRQLLIAEKRSMAEFFVEYAKSYLKKHNKLVEAER